MQGAHDVEREASSAVREGTDRMLELVLSLPEQIEQAAGRVRALDSGIRSSRLGFRISSLDSVVIAGMGGSGISGRIAQGLLWDESRVPLRVCNDYEIPGSVSSRTLFVAVSHSGDTEETLSAFAQARRRGCRIAAITGGGELGRQAAQAGIPVLVVPGGMPPRAALGHLFSTLLGLLEGLGLCGPQRQGLSEAVGLMRARRGAWLARARAVARHLTGRLPIVYSTSRLLDPVADRWRCQLNENAGVLCHSNSFPEHNHNEIVGMGTPGHPVPGHVVIALLDSETHSRTRLRLDSVLAMTRNAYYRAMRLETEGRSRLARVFSLVMLGDMTSVELAARLGKNAMEIERIVELKRRLGRRKG
jgi:glucose/mannose-6-phosphate isomerase